MENFYKFMIARLNGERIESDFSYYSSLVRKGIAGFIIFGGELRQIRKYVGLLQRESELPLIIASDLERGLGQHVKGGTLFPPAMAMAMSLFNNPQGISHKNIRVLKDTFRAFAQEASYAGINVIFAPVMDINTNPKNPIIAARAFGEDKETVSLFGCQMIKTLQKNGMSACAKHFPGHGDTSVDSHIRLPVIDRSMRRLRQTELRPFEDAIKAGVDMIMLGHLSVPAIDPEGIPVSFSRKSVMLLREKMGYKGILITDAMNMGGIGKYREEEASALALKAGVDIILHPSDPDKTASYLAKKIDLASSSRLDKFRLGLSRKTLSIKPDFKNNRELSRKLTEISIVVSKDFRIGRIPYLIILNDEDPTNGKQFELSLKKHFPEMKSAMLDKDTSFNSRNLPEDTFVIAAVFTETKAWKGGAGRWLQSRISFLADKANLFVSFGSPYVLDSLKGKKPVRMFAWANSDEAQRAAAEKIAERSF